METLSLNRPSSRLTRVGRFYLVVLAFVLGGAVIRDINLLLIVAGIMLGPLWISWRVVREMLRHVQVMRTHPSIISEGDRIHVQLTLTNLMRRRALWGITAKDHLRKLNPPPQVDSQGVQLLFPHVTPGQSSVEGYAGRILERGEYELGPLLLKTQFPMGLVESTLQSSQRQTLVVHPRVGVLSPSWSRTVSPLRIGTRTMRGRQAPSEGEFYGLRDFRLGDSRRWIHWRSSAKRRKLTVRQFQRWQNHDLALIVELPADCEWIEQTIQFVATVSRYQCRQGHSRLLLSLGGEKVSIIRGMASSGLFQDLMYHLAVVQASEQDTLPEALRLASEHFAEDLRVLFISPREIDIHDTERFSAAWDQVRLRPFLARALKVQVGSAEFHKIYQESV